MRPLLATPLPLRQQLLIAFLSVALLPVLLLGWLQYDSSRQEVSEVAQQAQAADLRTVISARNFAQSAISLSADAVAPYAADPGRLATDPAKLSRRLQDLANRLPLVRNIALVDRRGLVVASGLGQASVRGRAATPFVPGLAETLATGETVYGGIYRSPYSGVALLGYTMPIRRAGGPVEGAVVVAFDFEDYQRQFRSAPSPKDGSDLYIAARMGDTFRVVFSSNRPELASRLADVTREPPVAQALATRRIVVLDPYESPLNGRQEVSAVALVHPAGWVVVASSDYRVLSAISQAQASWLFLLLAVLGGLAVLGAIWLSRRFSKPLIDLSLAVRALPTGDLRLPERTGQASSEYAVLVESLQRAAQELTARRAAIEQSQRNLQALVQARTEALEATNRIIGLLAGTTVVEEGLVAIAPLLRRLVPFDHLLICRYDAEAATFTPLAGWPQDDIFPIGQSLPIAATDLVETVRGRRPLCEAELSAAGIDSAELARRGYRSRLVLPITLHNEQVVAMICLASRQPAAYDAGDSARLLPICEQIGLAMERQTLIAGLELRRRDAEALVRAAVSMNRSLRLEESAPIVLREMRDAFGADHSDLWLIDRESQEACCFASIGPQAELLQGDCRPRAELAAGGMADLIDAGEPVLIPDVRQSSLADHPIVQATGVQAIAIFPLKTVGPSLGFVILVYDRPGIVFPRERLLYAETLAAQAAVVVANARLFARLEDSLSRLQQVQEQLIRSERMSAIGQLASTVAHEIKNRFNVIQAAAFLVEMLAGRADTAERIKETVSKIKREVDRGNAIMMTLLQYARPKAPKRESVRLAEVVDTALAIARRANVTIVRRMPHNLPSFQGDPAQLEQVFLNLFLNAVQAMPHGGTLTVIVARDQGWLAISVQDTGVGMPEAVRQHLFEPFFTTKAGGTGLGLLITKQIVTQHGGSISCVSESGRGTTFTVRLPLAIDAGQAEAA